MDEINKNELKKFLSKGEIEKVLDILLSKKIGDYENEVLTISSHFHNLMKNERVGVISKDFFIMHLNSITYRLISVIDLIYPSSNINPINDIPHSVRETYKSILLIIKKKKYEEARKYLDNILIDYPYYEDALFERGIVNIFLKKHALAERDFFEILKINPNQYLAYQNLGVLYLLLNKKDTACRYLKKAKELNPDSFIVNEYIQTDCQ